MFSLNLFSNQCLVDSFTYKNSNKYHIVKETELTYSDLCSVCYSELVLINKYIFSHRSFNNLEDEDRRTFNGFLNFMLFL